ncbi:endoglucanase precursor [bacterium BMS3Bbin02]|nr:endoglucanase precursor [bacterium BMS3Bbin02]
MKDQLFGFWLSTPARRVQACSRSHADVLTLAIDGGYGWKRLLLEGLEAAVGWRSLRNLFPRFGVVGMSAVLVFASVGIATAGADFAGTFSDDDGNIHEANIEAIADVGITKGCNPPVNDLYCPGASVTRGQMAAFLTRALTLPSTSEDFFSDDDGSPFEADINRLAAADITKGCNPPVNDQFCPDGNVTRGQMAAFLTRAFGYADDGGGGRFADTVGSTFESDINKLATAGVTLGCNPPDNDRFCPTDLVKRDQMASFLARALGLLPIGPPPPDAAMCDDVTSIPVSECQALVSLYGATSGAGWTDNTGWLDAGSDPCDWFGVTCTGGVVTDVELASNNLVGTIPAEIANLTNLQALYLGLNFLSGTLPPELGTLSNLSVLNLVSNSLSGPIPPELGNLGSLVLLHLTSNQFSGSIPSELADLSNLQTLVLNSNSLTGTIPPQFGSMANLGKLFLAGNMLTGSIPSELGNLANLTGLHLVNNSLSGEIPAEFYAGLDVSQGGSLTFLTLGSNGCLAVPTPEPSGMTTWLAGLDSAWDDGCP